MIISKIDFNQYVLKLKTSFETAKGIISERKGFIICVTGENGLEACGDAAPLPGFASETFEQVNELLPRITTFNNKEFSSLTEIENALSDFNSSPAVKHGLDQALLNLYALENKKGLHDLFDYKNLNTDINVNSVIGSSDQETVIKNALAQVDSGYTTIKLKLGSRDFKEEIELLMLLRKSIGQRINIRIDVNGNWELNNAVDNLKRLEQFNIEYIEQPCSSLEELIVLAEKSSIPIAVDESLRSYEDAIEIIRTNSFKYIILRPMMLGGITTTQKIIKKAVDKGIKPVISSSFESVTGRKALVFLASLIAEDIAHGLGTDEYFIDGYENNPFPVKNGTIEINNLFELLSVKNDI